MTKAHKFACSLHAYRVHEGKAAKISCVLMCLHCAHTTLVLRLHDERHARAGRSATSSPTPGPRRGKYTTATHGTPRMAAVPSRCPCPSHPAVTRPDPAEPVQLCSKPPPASRSKPLNQSRPGLSGGATGHATGRVLAAHRSAPRMTDGTYVRDCCSFKPCEESRRRDISNPAKRHDTWVRFFFLGPMP